MKVDFVDQSDARAWQEPSEGGIVALQRPNQLQDRSLRDALRSDKAIGKRQNGRQNRRQNKA